MPKVYINLAQTLGVIGAVALGWKALDVLSGASEETQEQFIDKVTSIVRWKFLW